MSYDQGYQNQQQPYQQQVVYQQAQQYPYTQSSSLIQPQAVTVVQPGADTKKENDMALLLLVIGCFFPIVWPVAFFMTRSQNPEAKKWGNVSCIFFVLLLLLSIVATVVPIIIVVALGASSVH